MSSTPPTARILTIPSGAPFLDGLADALWTGALFPAIAGSRDPLSLARVTVLLPTRRAARELAAALGARAPGRPLFLPRIRALGDVDVADMALDPDAVPDFPDGRLAPLGLDQDDFRLDRSEIISLIDSHKLVRDAGGTEGPRERKPVPAFPHLALAPAIGELERHLLLTRLVQRWGEVSAHSVLRLGPDEAPLVPGSPAMAARLAAELARLMDAMETEGLDYARLKDIVPDGFAGYWQIALEFLKIITQAWPGILAERGLLPPAARRNLLLQAEAERLARQRPDHPIVAAGSTGSIPATARLLAAIARLPAGAVILPGLDLDSGAEDWGEILLSPSHPQHGMARLLSGMGAARADVAVLSGTARAPSPRQALAREAMKPAARTGVWDMPAAETLTPALSGLAYVAARTPQEEALAIALMLRETAQRGGETAALITPDRALARRVAAELRRWNIAVDDSAGEPLGQTAPGLFARMAADLLVDGLAPVPLLCLLKHPFATLGLPAGAVHRGARSLELAVLRGPRPELSLRGLRRALAAARKAVMEGRERDPARQRLSPDDFNLAESVVDRLAALLREHDAVKARGATMADLADAHYNLCLALCAGEEDRSSALLAGDAGRALADFFAELGGSVPAGWPMRPRDYPALFTTLLAGRPVRPQRPAHPRLHILGLLEARLLHFDRVILGGLNETVWPAQARTDPWLSRSMRDTLGLPAPERRIGLAAHDFMQAFCADNVVLTRAEMADGAPTVPSRWLLRLDALVQAAGGLAAPAARGQHWLDLARTLDARAMRTAISPPRPTPPLDKRPRSLSVTEIETWIRDPYAIYARHILKLTPLEALDQPPDAAMRGTLVHEAMARFIATSGDGDGNAEQAFNRLLAIGEALFAELPEAPEVKAFWWRRFARAARWFATFHAGERGHIARSVSEVKGALAFAAPGGEFTLRARADRLDQLDDGTLAIIDYKTGNVPSASQVVSGLAPQLPLEAAIALAGGFVADALPRRVCVLRYISLSGATPPGEVRDIRRNDAEDLAADALAGLKEKVARFDRAEQPYLSRPHPKFVSTHGDYDHLARVKEWSRAGGGEGE